MILWQPGLVFCICNESLVEAGEGLEALSTQEKADAGKIERKGGSFACDE